MPVVDLFSHAAGKDRRGQPLAERMRPFSLAEFVGQDHLLGPGRWLRRALDSKELTSLILWGPPGIGKTTLGRLLAAETNAVFVALSAVMSGVKEVREAVAQAAERRDMRGQRTLLFIDEIHRFNKAQQDALLPHVEAGTIILVGATTENPSFEVNAPLLSRAKVVVLKALSPENLRTIIDRALSDPRRGLGAEPLDVSEETRNLIAAEAGGDARRALAIVEAAASTAEPDAQGRKVVDAKTIEEALQRRTLVYDKAGDQHYEVVSAFIKSMRGSDPDAAVYWMARMLEAGEDPLFVARRMVIFAAEDIGNADPNALRVAMAATDAVRFVGMPEGHLPLTQAVLYMAVAPKSNTSVTAYAAAKADVEAHGAQPVPLHLRNASSSLGRSLGYGKDYKYPHNYQDHYVAEDYLPEALKGHRYYEPSNSGRERDIAQHLAKRREPK
jgi:putative ATPase